MSAAPTRASAPAGKRAPTSRGRAATDPFAWFNQPGIQILPAYVERRRLMESNAVPELND